MVKDLVAAGSVVAVAGLLATLARVALFTPPAGAAPTGPEAPRALRVEVVRAWPHDPDAFTQGLVLGDDGALYESTGLEGRSTLRKVEIETGRVLQTAPLAPDLFGEGLARVPGLLIQLTWTSERALVYDERTFTPRPPIAYAGEGWGLCYDGRALVMSDGGDQLTWRRPDTFAIERRVRVTLNGAPLTRLNELECVGGDVYANVWQTDLIVRIEAASGRVVDRIDASGLLSPSERSSADVLNGIAWDPADGLFYVTGKLWPKLFKVRFRPA